jgi:hypothetical protein
VEHSQEMAIGGQRYHRVTAQTGPVELVYEAAVDATHETFGESSRLQVPLFEQNLRSRIGTADFLRAETRYAGRW